MYVTEMIRQIKSKQFKLYAKPKYKSGWRNYQVDLTKPAFMDFAFDYGVNYQYESFETWFDGTKTIQTAREFYFTVLLTEKTAEWIRANMGKDFLVYCEEEVIVNGLNMYADVTYDSPAKIKIVFRARSENNRVFYIPQHKQLLLPHESLKFLMI